MSGDSTMAATLEPVDNKDKAFHGLVGAVIGQAHEGLTDAKIGWFWALDRALDWWGSTQLATEMIWWLTRVDVLIQINTQLWERLDEEARRGLVDHLLSFVQPKQGGKTEMHTAKGTRTLFEKLQPSLSVFPQVLARNPAFVAQIAELRRLQQAIEEPDQFLIDFAAGAEDEDEDEPNGTTG